MINEAEELNYLLAACAWCASQQTGQENLSNYNYCEAHDAPAQNMQLVAINNIFKA